MIWNDYSDNIKLNALILFLANFRNILVSMLFLFSGKDYNGIQIFKAHWWGILGLIGWVYLITS